MAPHRSNRKGDLGNYRPKSSAADIDNIFLTEEGWVYRHFKGNPRDPETRYWDEIIVAGQVDRDEERPSRNPIDYGTVIDNEPMLDTVNAEPRRYLGLGDSPEANSVDGYVSPHTGYGTTSGEIEFETVIDGVNRVIGATDGCFDYDYKHGTCNDDDDNSGGGGSASGSVNINLIKVTNGDIKVGDDVEFKVEIILEDGATDCNWKVAVVTTTRSSGELARGYTNESTTETFSVVATTAGIFNIEAIAIAQDTDGVTINNTDTINNLVVEDDIATGSCHVEFVDGPYEVDKGQECVANVTHQVFEGATFGSITLSTNQNGSITDLTQTTNGDHTEFRFKGGSQSGDHQLKAIFKALDSKGDEITPACTDTEGLTVYPQVYFRYKVEKPINEFKPLDTFDLKVISTSLQGVDRDTIEYKVTSTTGDIKVSKIGGTDRTGPDDITTFRVEIEDTASGQCRIYFNGAGKSKSGLMDVSYNVTDIFNISTPTQPYFYDIDFGWLDVNEDFATTDEYLESEVNLVNNGDEDQGVDDVDPVTVCYYHVMGADGESVDALSGYTYNYTNVFNGSSVGFLKGNTPAEVTYDGLTVYTRDTHPHMDYFSDAELQKLYVEKFTVTFSYNECTQTEQFEEWFDVSYTDSNGDDIYDADYWGRDRETVGNYIAFSDVIYDDSATGQELLNYTGLSSGTEFYVNESYAYLYDLYEVGKVETNYDEVKLVVDGIKPEDFVLEYEEGKDNPVWNKPIWHKTYNITFKATASEGAYFEEGEQIYAQLLNHSYEEVPGRSNYRIEFNDSDSQTVVSDDGLVVSRDMKLTVRYYNDPNDPLDSFKFKVYYPSYIGCDDYDYDIDEEEHEFRVEKPTQNIADVQEIDMTVWSTSKPQSLPAGSGQYFHELYANEYIWNRQPDHPWNNLVGSTPFLAKVNYDESTVSSSAAFKFNYYDEPATLFNNEYWNLKGNLSELSYKKDDLNYITVWDNESDTETPKKIKINVDYYLEDRYAFGSNTDRPFLSKDSSNLRIQIDVGGGYEDYKDQTVNEGDTFKIKIEIDRNPNCDFTMENVRFIGSLNGVDNDDQYLINYGEVTSTTTVTDDLIVGEFETTMINKDDKRVYFDSLILIEKVKAGEDTIRVAYPDIKVTNDL